MSSMHITHPSNLRIQDVPFKGGIMTDYYPWNDSMRCLKVGILPKNYLYLSIFLLDEPKHRSKVLLQRSEIECIRYGSVHNFRG